MKQTNLIKLAERLKALKSTDSDKYYIAYRSLRKAFRTHFYNKTLTIEAYNAVANILTDYEHKNLSVRIEENWFEFRSLNIAAQHLIEAKIGPFCTNSYYIPSDLKSVKRHRSELFFDGKIDTPINTTCFRVIEKKYFPALTQRQYFDAKDDGCGHILHNSNKTRFIVAHNEKGI